MSPVPASRPRVSKWGTYYAKPYRVFKDALKSDLKKRWAHPAISVPVVVSMVCLCTQPKSTKLDYPKPDVDNYAKAVLDAMNGVVLQDDTQVIELNVSKRWAPKGAEGSIQVTIKEL
jgi:Holliday junction resolvase RusA-like endonuclease